MAKPTHKNIYDDRTIGVRLRRIREYRGKSLDVIAGLAGITVGYLSRIERGERAIDSRRLLFALADALWVSLVDLKRLPVPAPGDSHTDSSVQAVRHALMAAGVDLSDGEVQSVEQLRHRYQAIVDGKSTHHGDFINHGAVLPGLIADVHTTLAQRREMAELLPLAVLLHGSLTVNFLHTARASTDLQWIDIMLLRALAEELEDPILLGFVEVRATGVMRSSGAFDLARAVLDETTVSTATNEGRAVNGMLALNRSLVAAIERRPAESAAALEYADELAAHSTGDVFAMGFCPVNVGLWRMASALECGEPDETIRLAKIVNPQEHPYPERQAAYWMDYGRALTSVRRRDDAAQALLHAEELHPILVLRNPFTRGALMELVTHAKDDALGREIRGMAYRAGLPL
jgi:transcriptional regulator with XRE-family HTH domain